MTIEYCDICEHAIGFSLSNAFPQIYRVRALDRSEEELMLCNKCRDRLFRAIRAESRRNGKRN